MLILMLELKEALSELVPSYAVPLARLKLYHMAGLHLVPSIN
jgi:hypothetical protein